MTPPPAPAKRNEKNTSPVAGYPQDTAPGGAKKEKEMKVTGNGTASKFQEKVYYSPDFSPRTAAK